MGAVDCSLTIYANCPHCDSSDTRLACSTTIVQHRNLFFASGMSDDEFPNDLEFKIGEALLKGWCLSCLRTFSIFLTSSTFNEEGLEELSEPVGVTVDFSVVGRPIVLRMGINAYQVSRLHSHKLMSSFLYGDSEEMNVGDSLIPYDPTLESLYGRAPFGSWDIEIDLRVPGQEEKGNTDNILELVRTRARCVLDISSNHLLGMLNRSYVDELSDRSHKTSEFQPDSCDWNISLSLLAEDPSPPLENNFRAHRVGELEQ